MSIAEEFLLLAYDEDGTPLTDGTRLDNGLGGAILLELALARRVDIQDKRVIVTDQAPTGDALADEALARIAEDKPRKPGHWVTKLSKQARPRILEKLVADGVLTVEKDKVLWVFPRTKYPSASGEPPAVEAAARERIRAAVLGTGPVEPRTGALCALVAATELDRKILGGVDPKQVKARLKEIGEGSWAADAVRKTIEEIQAAVMVAIIASTTAATAGSSA
ncbi:GOLPH3/VPS74 family protein [Paractinoplanes globisporus]|uniref:GPP34 family phosphoprotein n=1 Tax=Paractinoplanes globisporus TaxID=113565 RepID=A0ABW6WP09_9ACTN|nr:GPP34 family phosphoprotein [Actinoplanes globisporus]